MNTSKYVTAVISGDSRFTISDPIMKEDKGLKLKIKGIVFPANYEVDFSTSEKSGESVTMIGDASGVEIPEYLIKTGKDIYAFLYWVGDGYGRTPHTIRIPNKLRPDRTDITPEPAEQSVIDQTIAKLNEAVEHAPKIGEDGTWCVWDAETGEYVSTGQSAKGEPGEKGDAGSSGVYIGEDEPEDEDVGVWIETDGEPDEMPQPLKYVKDAPSDNGAVIEGNIGANTATGRNSHAEGNRTTASENYAHAEGNGSAASGESAHAEGIGSGATGRGSHAEGGTTRATGFCAHSEGKNASAEGDTSHAEGEKTTASGGSSHAEGAETTASGWQAHAEGYGTVASAGNSHAEGVHTTASGSNAHAEGTQTTASGEYTHAGGNGTIAQGKGQTVIGSFNVPQGDKNSNADSDYALIIGNGYSDGRRSNALAMKWDGTMVFANGTEITPDQFTALLALLGS